MHHALLAESESLVLFSRVFEAGMLLCFGCSWPAAIAKTLRVKRVEGKSIHFLLLVLVGYLSGITFRVLTSAAAGRFDWILLLYFALAAMVAAEIVLYAHYRKAPAKETTLPPVE